ncbi:hypothetical protein [Klebsiella pneumoniae]|uniref:hypothetical protein n=1 Tax=Klebsiella pneumoniae TaxID=573 RepID=UPI0039876D7F
MGWSLPEVPEKDQAPSWSPWICLLIIILWTFHWAAYCGAEITNDRVTFIEQWGLVTTDDQDLCGNFGSHRGLYFQPGNASNSCLELE